MKFPNRTGGFSITKKTQLQEASSNLTVQKADRQEHQTTTTVQKSTDEEDKEEVLQVFNILTMMSNLAINPAHMTRICMSKLQVAIAVIQPGIQKDLGDPPQKRTPGFNGRSTNRTEGLCY